jgi:hypothetical protein
VRVSVLFRVGQVLLCVLFALSGVIALSTLFVDDPFPFDAQVLIASFGLAFAVLGLIVAIALVRHPAGWLALWTLPLFLISHVIALGTWLPDAALAGIAIVALLFCRPAGTWRSRDGRSDERTADENALT